MINFIMLSNSINLFSLMPGIVFGVWAEIIGKKVELFTTK